MSETFQHQAYEYVKEQIINLRYKPSQVITDTQVAQELNISRTPVREAFHRLENEGLLINEARRGWRVYSLSIDDIHELFDIKIAIEGMLARCAAERGSEEERAELLACFEQMQAAAASGDSETWLKCDFKLHDIIFAMAGNARAERIVANLNDQWHRVRIGYATMRARMAASTVEHEAFVKAIVEGDAEAAQRLMEQHLDNVRTELVHMLTTLVLPFVENGV
jgi:DNA-binding GntR family transcriptional regulator